MRKSTVAKGVLALVVLPIVGGVAGRFAMFMAGTATGSVDMADGALLVVFLAVYAAGIWLFDVFAPDEMPCNCPRYFVANEHGVYVAYNPEEDAE